MPETTEKPDMRSPVIILKGRINEAALEIRNLRHTIPNATHYDIYKALEAIEDILQGDK